MIKPWRISVAVARDDGEPLPDAAIARLTERLQQDGMASSVTTASSGAILVETTVEATDDMAARSTAERRLREAANDVWAAFGLPPFTITFVRIHAEDDA